MSLESSSSTVDILARQLLIFNRIIPVAEMVANIEKVTIADIKKVAREIFASKPTYTLLGDIDTYMEYDDLINKLKF